MKNIVVMTGASSGFGVLTARALADAGHIVYAGMRQTDTRNAPQVGAAADYSAQHRVDLRAIELAVNSQESVDAAIDRAPGSFTSGTNHFAHSGHPADGATETAYETKYPGLMEQVAQKLAALAPEDADASMVSDEIARIVALPAGQRPYRVHIDPADDNSAEVSNVADRIRREFLARVDLSDLLTVHPANTPEAQEAVARQV